MSRKILIFVFLLCISLCINPKPAAAAENPLAVANNKMGIHILSELELPQAAQLVNSNGGDWGYVIVPIQSVDKDLIKWQKFMDDCKRYRVIPIIRIATEGDYFNTAVWREPNPADIIDFANFLDSLEWPTKNRYVIIFNEVNRGDEWGGSANPKEYAELLSFSVSVFKSMNSDFFIISAGMDNAAPEEGTKYTNQYNYLRRMNQAVPGIFNQIDGISSHSYPNPGFSQPPNPRSMMGVGSFAHERALIRTMSNKDLPVFITETGWSAEVVNDDKRAQYYAQAFQTVWSDPGIVTVMPFLLQAGAGPFQKFTFITADGNKTKQYQTLFSIPKVKGIPSYPTTRVLSAKTSRTSDIRDFSEYQRETRSFSVSTVLQDVFEYLINSKAPSF
ncbi:MAG: hypothetical protein H0W89_03090 [Candidatus Levybacteria bacterium]|nr:hypothetical protein [Candidatus Levybacteria bacterium]